MSEIIVYLHKCGFCHRVWKSESKVSNCPNCERQHVWFNYTSELKEKEDFEYEQRSVRSKTSKPE